MLQELLVQVLTSEAFWGLVGTGLMGGIAYLQKRKVNGLVINVLSQAGQNIVQQVEAQIVTPLKEQNGKLDAAGQALALTEAQKRFLEILEETGIKIGKENLLPVLNALIEKAGIKLGLIHQELPQAAQDLLAGMRGKV